MEKDTLEKIETEIIEKINHCERFNSPNIAKGLKMALQIVHKHKEKESK